jgi:hypothetical protein
MAAVNLTDAAALLGFDGQVVAGVRFVGVRVAAVVQPDHQEITRRAAAGLGILDAVEDYDLVDALAGLPAQHPVPWAEVDLAARIELDCAPPGVVHATSTHVRRLWRPAVQVTGVLVVARDWQVGIYQAGAIPAEVPRALALLRHPRHRPGRLLQAAGQEGLGVLVDEDGRWRRLLAPAAPLPATPATPAPPLAAAQYWRFLDAAHDAYRAAPPTPSRRSQQQAARRVRLLAGVDQAARTLGFHGHLVPDVRFAATGCTAVVTPDEAELTRRAAAGGGVLAPYRHYQLFEALAALPDGVAVRWADLEPGTATELDCAPSWVVHRTSTHVRRRWRPAVRVPGVLVASDRTMQALSQVSWFAPDAPRGLVALRRPRPATLAKAARFGIGVVAPTAADRWELLVAPSTAFLRSPGPRHWRFLEAVTAALLRQRHPAGSHGGYLDAGGQPDPAASERRRQ